MKARMLPGRSRSPSARAKGQELDAACSALDADRDLRYALAKLTAHELSRLVERVHTVRGADIAKAR